MGLDVKPPTYQGPSVRPEDETHIKEAADSKTADPKATTADENPQSAVNTGVAMKQAATEMKGSMKTTGSFLQQSLADKLEGKTKQNDARPELLGWPKTPGTG